MDELPSILVKHRTHRLSPLQIAHVRFLYERTDIPKIEICAMVHIEMSTLDRLIQRKSWPLRQPKHWTQRHRVNHKGAPAP